MVQFVVDVNLPLFFSLWNDENYIHQQNLDDEAKDSQIWDYAKSNNLTIITKDNDFSFTILSQSPPPKVIHIRLGNMKLRTLFETLSPIWSRIIELNKNNKLVTVYKDRIECIE